MISTEAPKERAFLVGAEIKDAEQLRDTADSLEELALLASVLVQLGDTLATIAAQKSLCSPR